MHPPKKQIQKRTKCLVCHFQKKKYFINIKLILRPNNYQPNTNEQVVSVFIDEKRKTNYGEALMQCNESETSMNRTLFLLVFIKNDFP